MLNEYQAWKRLEKAFKNVKVEVSFRSEFGSISICNSLWSMLCINMISSNVFDKMMYKMDKERKRRKQSVGQLWWVISESGRKSREKFCAKMAQECRSKK